jgi:peptidoglycan/LPS O-acetylase OafA/YrhL
MLCAAPLRFFGKYSYGIYVFHFPVFWLIRSPLREWIALHLANETLIKSCVTLMTLVLTVVLALVSYHFLEKPFLQLKKHFRYS